MDDLEQVIFYRWILQIQTGKFKMALPCFIAEGIPQRGTPTEIDPFIPVAVGRGRAFFLQALKSKKFTACMVKHTVYHYLNAGLVAERNEFLKIIIIS